MTSNTVRQIVVDDSDPDIHYSGPGWFLDHGSLDAFGNYGPAYLKSLHGTNSSGSLTYTFHGTGFQVFGTTRLAQKADPSFDPSWECLIDNASLGVTKSAKIMENNWLMCEGRNLIDGKHQLTVNVTTTNDTVWIGKIHYTPSPGILLPDVVVLVQNQDPNIFLDSAWQKSGGITKMTQVKNSTASILFTGTSLTWVGSILPDLSHNASAATYSVDGGPEVPFLLVGLPPDMPPTTIYNQEFFKTPNFSLGLHTLVVKHQGTSQQTPLILDALYITTSIPNSEFIAPSPSPGSHDASRSKPNKSGTHVGAIIGGVIGGLGLVALMILLFLVHKRMKRRAKPQSDSSVPTTPQRSGVSPYIYRSSTSGMNNEPSTSTPLPSHPQLYRKVPLMPHQNIPLPSAEAPDIETQATSSTSQQASSSISSDVVSKDGPRNVLGARELQERPLPPTPHVIEHEDSGFRLNRENVIHLPPTYTYD